MTNEQYTALSDKLNAIKELISADYGVLEASNTLEAKKQEILNLLANDLKRAELSIFEKSVTNTGFYIRLKKDEKYSLYRISFSTSDYIIGASQKQTAVMGATKCVIPFGAEEIKEIYSAGGNYASFVLLKNGNLYFAAYGANNFLSQGSFALGAPVLTSVEKLFLPCQGANTNEQAYAVTFDGDLYVVGGGQNYLLYTGSNSAITSFARVTKPESGKIKKIIHNTDYTASIILFENGNVYGVGKNGARQFGVATSDFNTPVKLPFTGVKDAYMIGSNNKTTMMLLFNDATAGFVGNTKDLHASGSETDANLRKIVNDSGATLQNVKQILPLISNSSRITVFALTQEGDLYNNGGAYQDKQTQTKFTRIKQGVESIKEIENPQWQIRRAVIIKMKDGSFEVVMFDASSGGIFGGDEFDASKREFTKIKNPDVEEIYYFRSQDYLLAKMKTQSILVDSIFAYSQDGRVAQTSNLTFL